MKKYSSQNQTHLSIIQYITKQSARNKKTEKNKLAPVTKSVASWLSLTDSERALQRRWRFKKEQKNKNAEVQ